MVIRQYKFSIGQGEPFNHTICNWFNNAQKVKIQMAYCKKVLGTPNHKPINNCWQIIFCSVLSHIASSFNNNAPYLMHSYFVIYPWPLMPWHAQNMDRYLVISNITTTYSSQSRWFWWQFLAMPLLYLSIKIYFLTNFLDKYS